MSRPRLVLVLLDKSLISQVIIRIVPILIFDLYFSIVLVTGSKELEIEKSFTWVAFMLATKTVRYGLLISKPLCWRKVLKYDNHSLPNQENCLALLILYIFFAVTQILAFDTVLEYTEKYRQIVMFWIKQQYLMIYSYVCMPESIIGIIHFTFIWMFATNKCNMT